VPASLHATASSAEIVLNWSAGAGATSYAVKRGTASGGPYTQIGTATSTSYTDSGLTNGTAYYYVVVAVNSVGQSAPSAQTTATPVAPLTVPPPPVGLAALAANAQVRLTWTASTGASSYQIKRATTGHPYTEVGTATSTSYTDTGLTNGTAYYYVVVAVNSAGQSAPSGEATATPNASSGCIAGTVEGAISQ
jgi:fibronectin type 3 domain-containing protein